MASSEVLHLIEEIFLSSEADNGKSGGLSIEKKIQYLESLTGAKVSNRLSRRWINDHLLMELVPRLNADEIRGLFGPAPSGDDVGDLDRFHNMDIDKRADIIDAKRRTQASSDKMVALNAWHRMDSHTRDVLRQSFLTDVLEGYEGYVRNFIKDNGDKVLTITVQDPLHRLLLHGVCQFYNLVSGTFSASEGTESSKMTRVTKNSDAVELPNMMLCDFLKMSKKGTW